MSIQSIGPVKIGAVSQAPSLQKQTAEKPFMDTLKESLAQVDGLKKGADIAMTRLTTGENQEIHQTMIAIEKADVSFKLMMQVRNKILSAYEEISRMQI